MNPITPIPDNFVVFRVVLTDGSSHIPQDGVVNFLPDGWLHITVSGAGLLINRDQVVSIVEHIPPFRR